MNASMEAKVRANAWIRQLHRWVSIAFTGMVMLNFAVWGREELGVWVGTLTLLPLSVLLVTGLYLFVLPYVAKRRGQPDAPTTT